jgi:hypothetical protein
MPRPFVQAQAFETTPRPPIALQVIKSERVAAQGYDPITRTLAVQFKPKPGLLAPVYHYPEVSPEQYATFVAPETAGSLTSAAISLAIFKKYQAEPLPALES